MEHRSDRISVDLAKIRMQNIQEACRIYVFYC